ncbi:MAG: acyl carrier protein [Cyclobacteriaceae bacterium]
MSDVSRFIQVKVAETLGVKPDEVNPDEEFMSLGLDSMHAIFLIDEIEREYKIEINPHNFWEFPTVNSFSTHLQKLLG